MTITLEYFICFSAILFSIGLLGVVINRKNIITILMSIELMLLAANTNFLAFSYFYGHLAGRIVVFFTLTVAAAEAAIGLALAVLLHRRCHTIALSELTELKG